MSTEFVTVGCRLPNGMTLEVGFSTTARNAGGAPFARYRQHADYQAVTLKGTGQHLFVRHPATRKVITTLPSQREAEPWLNQVPKDFWDRWSKEHADSWLLKSGQLFVIPKPDAATIKAASADAQATSPAVFQPLDPSQPFKVEDHTVTKREDE